MVTASRSLEWNDRLEAARSVADVVEVCLEFVGRFAPSLLSQLPRNCLPPLNLDAATISAYAVELVRMELEAGADASPVLSTFALFFTDASHAVAHLATARKRPELFSPTARRG